MPKKHSYNAEYGGIKVSHAGDWDKAKYHSHQEAHPNKLQETSEKRAMKPRPRPDGYDKPKPTTKILDLSTGKSKEIEAAVQKDWEKRNIRPENHK